MERESARNTDRCQCSDRAQGGVSCGAETCLNHAVCGGATATAPGAKPRLASATHCSATRACASRKHASGPEPPPLRAGGTHPSCTAAAPVSRDGGSACGGTTARWPVAAALRCPPGRHTRDTPGLQPRGAAVASPVGGQGAGEGRASGMPTWQHISSSKSCRRISNPSLLSVAASTRRCWL